MKDDLENMLPAKRTEQTVPSRGILMDPDRFAHAQRVAGMMALTPMFPAHLRSGSREESIANAMMVLNLADRLNEDPLAVAQSVYFVGGKPGWSAAYVISKANQSGIFKGRINWRIEGEGEAMKVTAYATLAETGEEISDWASMKMAKDEGWVKNPKYRTMPERMLRYRSAVFLVRAFCPEVLLGYSTQEELIDITPEGHEVAGYSDMSRPDPRADADDAEIVEQKAAPKAEEKPKAAAKAKAEEKPKAEPKPEKKAETKPEPEPETEAEAEPAAEGADRDALDDIWTGLVDSLEGQLESASDLSELNDVLSMFEGDITDAKESSPPAHAVLVQLIDARKAALKG